ncbi:maleylpyruvate isomerase family mycothiol-dependent enzyme [Nocardioides litoris]|uniref:maleylpyruvate isomerase family mycothiol-dependent enzyme n=1 Tax=Nocardioides litoris TaxID=1926648 RepID=UPI001476BD51|nr:maleylpyruvate isomerase family mycothiol-dependent enzyme [Nocardioides litoris]
MTTDADAWTTIAQERGALADLLDTLTPGQWATQSLCGAWTVKEVAVHLMVGPTGSLPSFATAMLKARGRFEVANQVMVDRRSDRPTAAVSADLRDHAASRFTPPGFDWPAPLTDLLVHRLDITVPLGLDHDRPLGPWADALTFLLTPKAARAFVGARPPALTLAATDLAWTGGSGPRVEGPAEALGLALTRRTPRLGELAGPGAEVLRAWAAGNT